MKLNEFLNLHKWVGLVFVFIFGAFAGISRANYHKNNEITALKQQYAEEAQKAALDYARALDEAQQKILAWQTKANQLSHDVLAANEAARKLSQKQKRNIDHAIKQDKSNDDVCIDGFGTHSLQQYKESLGYDHENCGSADDAAASSCAAD